MYTGFWLREAHPVVFYEGLRLWGGPNSYEVKENGGSANEIPSRAWGQGRGRGSWDHMSSSDVGSYEFK